MDLLGANPQRLPPAIADARLPDWPAQTVLRAWGTGGHYMHTTPVGLVAGSAASLWSALRVRWPNPIQVTIDWNRSFDEAPRLPVQLAECVLRSGRFLLGRPTATPRA